MSLGLVFPPTSLETVVSVVGIAASVMSGLSEARGKHLAYSKFAAAGAAAKMTTAQVPSRIAMVSVYTPAFIVGAASFWAFRDDAGLRFLLLKSAITAHFFKRIFESVFIHRYSGVMPLTSLISIATIYMAYASGMIYTQHTAQGLALEPALDLKSLGLALFLVGLAGNFYHHVLLSNLRSGTQKEYRVPCGGLFELVVCPHYLFEILGFWGVACIGQTMFGFMVAMATSFYLAGRSVSTLKWYLGKFDDFPRHRKALIPFIF